LLSNKVVLRNDVFSTIRPQHNSFVKAFEEKIDFSTIELHYTDSPHLVAARCAISLLGNLMFFAEKKTAHLKNDGTK
jgi:hypothetical protein